MHEIVSITGPVERSGSKLMLRIPLDVGGDKLAACSTSISQIKDGFLCIEIQDWLAAKLEISEGSLVSVNNTDGKFNISRKAE